MGFHLTILNMSPELFACRFTESIAVRHDDSVRENVARVYVCDVRFTFNVC